MADEQTKIIPRHCIECSRYRPSDRQPGGIAINDEEGTCSLAVGGAWRVRAKDRPPMWCPLLTGLEGLARRER